MRRRSGLARARAAVGLSQEALAHRVGVDRKTVYRWENGLREPQPCHRHHLAAALAMPLVDLDALLRDGSKSERGQRGSDGVQVGASVGSASKGTGVVVHPAVARIEDAMRDVWRADTPPLTVSEFREQVRSAWDVWHLSQRQRTEVGSRLPRLLQAGHAVVRAQVGEGRRRACAANADLYRLTQRFLAHISPPALHELAVERGRRYSEEADSPLQLACAAWSSSVSASAMGEFDEAIRIAETGSRALTPYLDAAAPEVTALYGSLALELAAAHGFAGRQREAIESFDTASAAAARLPVGWRHRQSGFQESSAPIIWVIVNVAWGRRADAMTFAERLDPSRITSRVRRARLLLEMSLAHSESRDLAAALLYLRAATDVSLEAVSFIPWARTLSTVIVDSLPRSLNTHAAQIAAAINNPVDVREASHDGSEPTR